MVSFEKSFVKPTASEYLAAAKEQVAKAHVVAGRINARVSSKVKESILAEILKKLKAHNALLSNLS